MNTKRRHTPFLAVLIVLVLIAAACGGDDTASTDEGSTETTVSDGTTNEPLKFGMILVGPYNDRGWSQAHFEAGEYLEKELGAEMVFLDKVNVADTPDKTVDQVAAELIEQGAQIVFMTSDDMKQGALQAAKANPDIPMIWSSGDNAWSEGEGYEALDNLGNIMGKMEFGKMMAGCAAGLTTETGSIGYLGPLVNDETRRLVNSAYLGARYCWENYRGEDPAALNFAVTFIGFWFNIPGVTLDPTQIATGFLDGGADVLISGIDTTEALKVAGQRADAGESVWAIPYDYQGACDEAPSICLGVPYFNWGPAYLDVAKSVIDGNFEATWDWNGPDWADLNNPDTTAIGFLKGPGLSSENASTLDTFIAGLADGSINLFTGPLNYQDGTPWLTDGEEATDFQIWYSKNCLEGVTGSCEASGE